MSRARGLELVQDHVQHGLPGQATEERLGGSEGTILGEFVDRSPAAAETEVRAGSAALLDSLGNVPRKRGEARRGCVKWGLSRFCSEGQPAHGDCGVNEEELRKRLEALKIEHRDLDAAIDALATAGGADQLQIARLKKRKLKLKDQIALVEDYLIPDIIA